jgi:DNA-binding NarL/FixJ family response regulator
MRVIVAASPGTENDTLVHYIENMPGISVVRVTDFASVPAYYQPDKADALILNAADAVRAAEMLLSPRELEVFRLLSTGLSNRQLSRSLGITERTVKAHVGSIMRKLGLESRLQVGLAAHGSDLPTG